MYLLYKTWLLSLIFGNELILYMNMMTLTNWKYVMYCEGGLFKSATL